MLYESDAAGCVTVAAAVSRFVVTQSVSIRVCLQVPRQFDASYGHKPIRRMESTDPCATQHDMTTMRVHDAAPGRAACGARGAREPARRMVMITIAAFVGACVLSYVHLLNAECRPHTSLTLGKPASLRADIHHERLPALCYVAIPCGCPSRMRSVISLPTTRTRMCEVARNGRVRESSQDDATAEQSQQTVREILPCDVSFPMTLRERFMSMLRTCTFGSYGAPEL